MRLVAVFVGGLIGTGLRLGVDALIPAMPVGYASIPWSTFAINVAGSFALGFLVARAWPVAPEWLRFGLGTGLLGSFTTFSAIMVSAVTDGLYSPLLALAYVAGSVVVGFGAAALGLALGRSRPPRQITADE